MGAVAATTCLNYFSIRDVVEYIVLVYLIPVYNKLTALFVNVLVEVRLNRRPARSGVGLNRRARGLL